MGRPQRIKKKNSILFTTKHHSFNGVMGTVLFAICLTIMITCVILSFRARGDVPGNFGYYGFFSAVLNFIGLIAGILGLRERDVYIVAPIFSISGNAAMLAAWTLLLFISRG